MIVAGRCFYQPGILISQPYCVAQLICCLHNYSKPFFPKPRFQNSFNESRGDGLSILKNSNQFYTIKLNNMQNVQNSLVLRKEDYALLISYLKNADAQSTFNKQEADDLKAELEKATLVDAAQFPKDVVGMHSKVTILEEGKDKPMELMIVKPEEADIKAKKISIMAPMGTALIGFRKGRTVKWKVPGGIKTFTIIEVENEALDTHAD